MTCLGRITVRRRWWRCRCGREPGSFAADAVLGLATRWSRRLQEHLARLSADGAFAQAREHVHAMLGVELSVETVRCLSHRHGQQLTDWQPRDEASVQAFRAAAGHVELTVDAGKVNTREEGWKDLKIAVFQKREAGRAVTPDAWQEQRLPAPTARLAWGEITGAEQFCRPWRRWAQRLGVERLSALQVVADGAAWIWQAVEQVLPGCQQTLDIYHGCEHLAAAGEQLYGEGSVEGEQFFHRGRELLLAKGWHGIGQLLAEEYAKGETPKRQQAMEKLVNYFSKHKDRLAYRARLAAGQVIGSGAVEGQAKTLGLRLKARGARWKKKNVRGMTSLVCVRHTSQWATYWRLAA